MGNGLPQWPCPGNEEKHLDFGDTLEIDSISSLRINLVRPFS